MPSMQRVLADVERAANDIRGGSESGELKLVVPATFAQCWLMPRLLDYASLFPRVRVHLDTDDRALDSDRQFDLWIAFTDRTAWSMPTETLFAETLVPVCSPRLLGELGRPAAPADLREFPLLYELARESYWGLWFGAHGLEAPDLSRAFGFRQYVLTVQAAVGGLGVALGRSNMVEPELREGTLVRVLESGVVAPERYVLATAPASANRMEVREFRDSILAAGGRRRPSSGETHPMYAG